MVYHEESLADAFKAVSGRTLTDQESNARTIKTGCALDDVPVGVFALDIETNYDNEPLPYKKLRTIAIANSCGAWVWEGVPDGLFIPERAFVYHNSLFDASVLRGNKFNPGEPVADTMLMAHHLWPGMPADLGFVAAFLTDLPRWKAPPHKTVRELMRYNALDAYMTWKLFEIMKDRMSPWFWEHTMANVRVGIDICVQGVPIDPAALLEHKDKLGELVATRTAKVQEMARLAGYEGVINLSSPKQVGRLFCETLGARVLEKTDGGQAAFGKTALTKYCMYGDPRVETIARELLSLRKFQKLKEAFIDGLPVRDGKVYPQFKPEGTLTGRWSCNSPNLQQIPKSKKAADGTPVPGLRNLFATDGWWVVCGDFSQQEILAMALISGEDKMIEAAAAGVDMHKLNAAALFKCAVEDVTKQQRQLAKIGGLAAQYGIVAVTLREQLAPEWPGITQGQCATMIRNYLETYPKIAQWHKKILASAKRDGYITKHISGQRIYFHGFVKPNECYNVPVQGMGADVLSLTLRKAELKVGEDIQWLALVHDEIALMARDPLEAARVLVDSMAMNVEVEGRKVRFNVEVKIGRNWGATKDFAIKPGWEDEVRKYVETAGV
jgi:DNA polymerase-1